MSVHTDRVTQAYATLPAPNRAAFVAGCISRITDVLANYKHTPHTEAVRVVELLWSLAEGQPQHENEARTLKNSLARIHADAKLNRDAALSYAILTVLDGALFLENPSLTVFSNASSDSVSTAGYADEANHELATREEQAWQEQALALLQAQGPAALSRTMFDGIGAAPAEWMLRWESVAN